MCFAKVFVKFWVFQPNREADENALKALTIVSSKFLTTGF